MSTRAQPSSEDRLQPLEVWYDGDCALCRSARSWAEGRDSGGLITFADLRDPTAVEPHPRSSDQMWARDQRGRVLGGFAAWLEILARLPGWRWLARVASSPPLSWLGPPVYRLVAANRRRLSLLLSSRPPAPARPGYRPPSTAPRRGPGPAPPA